MRVAEVSARNPRNGSRLGLPLTLATGFAFLFVALAVWTGWANYQKPSGGDFISFWSAGRLVLQGHSSAAYDIAVHRAIEKVAVPGVGLIPFPYPPPFLIVVTPFALPPFGVAFVLWITATAALYALAVRRLAHLAFGMANPPMLVDYLSGQTGLFISAIFIGGLSLLPTMPFTAGVIMGLLVTKPQVALLLPFAMIAGRQWRAIAGAIASSMAFLLVAWLLFGTDTFRSFFEIVPRYVHYMQQNRWDWREFASVFALGRYIGLDQGAAFGAQLIVAVLVAAVTSVAWLQGWSEKMPILAAGSLLMSGYLLTYDALLLVVPAAYFAAKGRWGIVGVLWILTALPVVHFFKLYDGPNTIPIASIVSIALLSAPHLKPIQSRA